MPNKDIPVSNLVSKVELRYPVGLPVLITLGLLFAAFSLLFHYAQGGAVNVHLESTPLNGFPIVNDPKLKVEEVFEGLHFPTGMVFLGSADVLVTEKNNGTIQRISNWNIQHSPILDVNVATRHSRGILGISVGNGFAHKYVFVYFTRSSEQNDTNGAIGEKSGGSVIYRYELTGTKLSNPLLLLKLPPKNHPDHNGGALIIGQDKNIYISIGDGGNDTTKAQNIIGGDSPNGSGGILTMTQQGSSGHNILGNTGIVRKYYAYGIRNSFGLDFDPMSGKLWDTENGPSFGDEINLVEPGFNSGWAKVQGIWKIVDNPSGEPRKGEMAREETINLVDFGGKGKYSEPEFTWNNTVGPTALIFLKTDRLGREYKNDMFVSDIKNGRIYHFKLNEKRDSLNLSGTLADKVADSEEETSQLIFGSGFGGITDMKVGTDGYLYVLSFGKGSIYRISPK